MTAETEVCKVASEVVGIEEKSGLDTVSCQDLPKTDCNGIEHRDHTSDPDNSYVFVTGTDGLSDDPLDNTNAVAVDASLQLESKTPVVLLGVELDGQNGKLDMENGEVNKSLKGGKHGSAEGSDGNLPVVNGIPAEQEISIVDGDGVQDTQEENIWKSKCLAEFGAQNGKLDVENGEVTNPFKEGGNGNVEDTDGKPSLVNGILVGQESSFEDGDGIQDTPEENIRENECQAEAEIKQVEDPNRKIESPEEIEIEKVEDQNEKIGGVAEAEQEKAEDQLISESSPGLEENQESEGPNLGLVAESGEEEEMNNLLSPFNEPVKANDECEDENNLGSTEPSQHVVAGAVDCELQDASTEENGVQLAREEMETAEPEVPLATSVDSNLGFCAINNKQETVEEDAKSALGTEVTENRKWDTVHGNNVQCGLDKEKIVASNTDCHVETVCDQILEEKNKEDFSASHVEDSVQYPEDPDKHHYSNGISPEIMNCETETEASVLTQSLSASGVEVHELPTEVKISDAETVGVVCSSPVDGPESGIVGNGPFGHDSWERFTANSVTSGSDSTLGTVVCNENEPIFQGGDAHNGTEVSSGNSEDGHSPPASVDVKLEPEVHNSSAVDNIVVTSDATVTSRTEVSDNFVVDKEGASNIILGSADAKDVGDQLGGAMESSPASVDVKLEPEVHNSSAVDNIVVTSDVTVTSRTEVSESFVVDNEGASNLILESADAKEVGDQLGGAMESSPASVDVKIEPEVHNSSAVDNIVVTSDITVTSRTEVSESFVVDNEGASNIILESADAKAVGDQLGGAMESSAEILLLQKNEDTGNSHSDDISKASPEGSSSDVITGEDVSVDAVAKPFNFLIRIPRFNDEKLKEQIRDAKLEVDQKTKLRDAIQAQIQEKRANNQIHGVDYEYAKGEDRSVRKLVRLKRMEIDSLQSVINKAKNAISIEDMDSRINNMEHMIQHETLALKEEKQLIREIKQLKQLREQLSSNMGSQNEIQQALEQREKAEERLKTLKKELGNLKDSLSKAQTATVEAESKYDDENKKVKELQAQFRAADDVRQEAYAKWQSLRKELSQKNKNFFKYKDDESAAHNYAFSQDREALFRLCTNQVEKFMDLWNRNDEFRREYVRFNARSTVRRLGTLDGRSLGPDEKPPILPSYVNERNDRMVSIPANADSISQSPILGLKQQTTVETVTSDFQPMKEVTEHKNQAVTTKGPAKPKLGNSLATVSGRDVTDEVQPVKTWEEVELIRKAEETRREEAEAKLKEQRRLEELAKAKEAREKKKRHDEKIQIREESRARKEAELKEKEKEKKLRKKERKKAASASTDVNDGSNSTCGETSESAMEIGKDIQVNDNSSSATTKKAKKASMTNKQNKTKSVPPPLRNRNKKKWQQWMWVSLTSLAVIVLFWLGNMGVFGNVNLKRRSPAF